jgi:hypothetical protein
VLAYEAQRLGTALDGVDAVAGQHEDAPQAVEDDSLVVHGQQARLRAGHLDPLQAGGLAAEVEAYRRREHGLALTSGGLRRVVVAHAPHGEVDQHEAGEHG